MSAVVSGARGRRGGSSPGVKGTTMAKGLALLTIVAASMLAACGAPASAPPGPAAAGSSAAPSPAAGSAAPAPAAAAAAAAPARESVKYGYVAILPGAPNFIAQERGYFAEQGIDVEW